MIALEVLLLAVVSATNDIHDPEDSCLSEDNTTCGTPKTIHPEYLPTESRLRRNLIDWQNHYDVNFAGPLTPSEIENYYQNGFLLVEDLLPTAMLDDCLRDVDNVVDKIAHTLYNASLISDLCNMNESINTFNRLTCIEEQYFGASILIHKLGTLYDSFINVWNYDKLLDIAAQLLQSNAVDANPIWNVRSKLPQNEASSVPWHQDIAYYGEESWRGHVLTLWIPLLDIKASNGAMQLINKGHLPGNIATHTCCFKDTWYVDLAVKTIENEILPFIPGLAESDVDESETSAKNNGHGTAFEDLIETVEMRKGSVLFFNNVIPHRSLSNYNDKIRWTIDIRYGKHGEDNGYESIKPSLKLRDSDDKNFAGGDWSEWKKIDRNKIQHSQADLETAIDQDLSRTMVGPWFDLWEIANENNHTNAYFKQ